MDGKVFANWLYEIIEACQEINDTGLCEECPMRSYCIYEMTFADIAHDCPRDCFEEILKMGQDPKWYVLSDDEKEEINARAW